MAGDWIKLRADLLTHPKVVRIATILNADRLRVIGGLHAVWCLFDVHSSDGMLDGYTSEVLDGHLGWLGFSAAMIKVRWLEENGENLTVPEFDKHNGQSAKRRAQETERKRLAREQEDLSAIVADKKRSKEQKRTEDKKEDKEPAAKTFVLPDWIPQETWTLYCKVRSDRKAKNEPQVLSLILKELEKFRDAGYDPLQSLNNSITNSWTGVFEPKVKFPDKNATPPVSRIWHESAAGVDAKAKELGINPIKADESRPAFKLRVRNTVNSLEVA